MPINVPEKWSDVMNRPDYTSGDPTVKLKKQEEWLSKIRTANEGNPDFSESIYEGIKNKVMLKEQPQNQYTQQEPAFDIDTGIKLQPGQDISQVFPEFPIRQELPPEPPPGKKLDTTMLEEMKWTDILSSQFYNAAAPDSKKVIADQWLSYQQSIRSPIVYDGIKKKVYETLPISTGQQQPALPMDKTQDQTSADVAQTIRGKIKTLVGLDNPTFPIVSPPPQRTPEQIAAINKEQFDKKQYETVLATEEEIKKAGLDPKTIGGKNFQQLMAITNPLIGPLINVIPSSEPKIKTLADVQGAQEPDFIPAMFAPENIVAGAAVGGIWSPTKGVLGRAMSVLDGAFAGMPRLGKGLMGMAMNIVKGPNGLKTLEKVTGYNSQHTLDAVETHLADMWQNFADSEIIKEGKHVGTDLLERQKGFAQQTYSALKKYAIDNNFSPEETRALLRFGTVPQTQPSLYTTLKPYVQDLSEESIQPSLPGFGAPRQAGLPLRASIPEPIITQGKIPTPPPRAEDYISSGIAAKELDPFLTITNRRLEETPSTMIGAGIKAYQIGQRSPQRFFEQAGGNIKKEIYDPIQDGHDRTIREMWERFRPRFFSWQKEGNGDRVGYYLFNKDEQARNILSKQGINIDKEVMKLTPKELEHANEIQGYFEELFHRVNAARIQAGMKPIAKRSNYITFFRQMDWMKENLGYDIFNRADLDKDILYRFVDFNSTIFKHAKERGRDEGIPIATDAYKIFMKYANSALDHINLTPPISRGQRLNLQLAKSDPKLHAEINHWLNFVAGKEDHPDGFFTKPLWDLVHTLNRNAAFGVVALSARTIWNQGTAGIITVTETGLKNALAGGIHYLASPTERRFIEKNSNLIGRKADFALSALYDIANPGTRKSKMDYFTKGVTIADYWMSSAAWSAFYKYGKQIGLKNKDLIRYANDMVIKTQGSGARIHLPRFMRSDVGRLVYTLQNFTTGRWTWLTEDVLKLGTGVPRNNKEALKKVLRLVGATTAYNYFSEDVAGLPSADPTPAKAWTEEMNKQDPSWGMASLKAIDEIAQYNPTYSTFRFGGRFGGAAVSTVTNALDTAMRKRNITDALIQVGKLGKIPEQPLRMIKEFIKGEDVEFIKSKERQKKKKTKPKMEPMSGGGDLKPISPPGSGQKKPKISITPLS